MKNLKTRYPLLTVLMIVTLLVSFTQPVFAQEVTNDIEITGTIISVDDVSGSFTVQTETGETYTIVPDTAYDLTTVQVDAQVTINGTLNEDGSISPGESGIIVEETPEPDEIVDTTTTNYYCGQSEDQHPFGTLLAEEYGTDYATLQSWVCDSGSSWGQVMLALKTGKLTGESADTYLAARNDGFGWGQIWQEAGLIGKEKQIQNKNEEKIKTNQNNGKSDKEPGPPEDKGPKKEK